MIKNFLLGCNLFTTAMLGAADIQYPVSTIPAELKQNADVVIRKEELKFKIVSKSKAVFTVNSVYTILNDRGKRYATSVVSYDKLSKVNYFSAVAFDANGKQIKRLKNSEFYDQSAFDGFSLYSDNRIKVANLTQGFYPYTVAFEYELDFKYLFFIPSYAPLYAERTSLENASYTLLYPKELEPRYKTQNLNSQPVKTQLTDGWESVAWSFKNLLPLKFEPHGPRKEELVTKITSAPSTFSYEGYEGSMSTWDTFGQWINSLNKGRDVLPLETIRKIRELTANLKTTDEKAMAVYNYLQNKTRYVSIQLGIGGHQPFEAQVVDNTGYGDCKALSNYTVAMLAAAGVKANYVLIKAGQDEADMITDFPSSQFNHVVVAVPNVKDTIWLECTSQTNPFGYMGTFTGDRKALMITESGGIIVKTPAYTQDQNMQTRFADVSIDEAGNATASVRTTYQGLQYENGGLYFVVNSGTDEQKKWIQQNTDIPAFDVTTFSITNNKKKIPSAEVKTNLILNRLATVTGKRMFITPNLMNRINHIPEKNENRKSVIVNRVPYTHVDTVVYNLPEAIYPEFVPEPVKIKSRFGEYESSYHLEQGKIIYMRKLKMNKGEFPADTYTEFVEFYKNLNKADNAKVVFVNKT
ncbi:MAG: DUF3857 domain-containing transglutaminase family protein [Cyclobacteriaceae bacterium]|nr:DUF3857 domain-containing transglutaminase family protein [Cyclobacteriaceae bacterium]